MSKLRSVLVTAIAIGALAVLGTAPVSSASSSAASTASAIDMAAFSCQSSLGCDWPCSGGDYGCYIYEYCDGTISCEPTLDPLTCDAYPDLE